MLFLNYHLGPSEAVAELVAVTVFAALVALSLIFVTFLRRQTSLLRQHSLGRGPVQCRTSQGEATLA
jgi:hypothetical protein